MGGRFWQWFRSGSQKLPTPYRCPLCGAVVAGEPGDRVVVPMGWARGTWYTPPNLAELIARCPEHGHSPYNDGK